MNIGPKFMVELYSVNNICIDIQSTILHKVVNYDIQNLIKEYLINSNSKKVWRIIYIIRTLQIMFFLF